MEKTVTLDSELEHVSTMNLVARSEQKGGFLLDVEGRNLSVKTSKDGHTILIPQPSGDPSDPVSWSWTKKHRILFIVAWGSLTADFTSAAGVPCIFLQGAEWHMKPDQVSYANNLNVLMMGIGGILWISFISFWGRAPVIFWAVLIGTLFTIGAAVAPTYEIHYAMRALQGLFVTAPQTISVAVIEDIFFFHERAHKIGLWACIYISSPFLGPLLANFIVGATNQWRPVFWMCVGVCGLQLIMILLFLDESYYNRRVPAEQQPVRASRILRVLGIWQIRNHSGYFSTFRGAVGRLVAVITKPSLVLIAFAYFLTFMWSIGINITTATLFATPVEFGGYGYDSYGVGYLYFTPIVGTILGEIFGHWFNDFIARQYTHRHKGFFVPEVRLNMTYISILFMVPGLVILGQALQRHLGVAAVIMGWGMFQFGIMTESVAITSYAIDSFSAAPGEVAVFINFMRVIGGFSVGYFQQPWGLAIGFDVSFGIQAAIVAFTLVPLGLAHRYGKVLRRKGIQIE
ncbi:hypothetical protein VF21_04896 [Pseudogymnoascus sp. 05NY08]|nr:hypothetical protein VF21_04896 [Pseudogymnoascus sp. 05NY08]